MYILSDMIQQYSEPFHSLHQFSDQYPLSRVHCPGVHEPTRFRPSHVSPWFLVQGGHGPALEGSYIQVVPHMGWLIALKKHAKIDTSLQRFTDSQTGIRCQR